MARRDKIGSQLQCCIQEYIKLNFTIAKDVGIRGTASLIFGEHVVYYPFFIFLTEVNRLEGNAEMLCDDHRIIAVVKPWTFIADSDCVIMPVLHEHAYHLISLLLE